MDINSMNSLFSMITLFFSVYCLYAWYQLRGSKRDVPADNYRTA